MHTPNTFLTVNQMKPTSVVEYFFDVQSLAWQFASVFEHGQSSKTSNQDLYGISGIMNDEFVADHVLGLVPAHVHLP